MSVHASISLAGADQVQCHIYATRTSILSITDRAGSSITVTIREDLPAEQQIELADQLAAVAAEFAEAIREYHQRNGGRS